MSFKKPSYEKPIINMKKYKDFRVRISQVPPMDVAFQSMAMGEYELLVATIYRLNDLIEVTNNYTEKIDEVLEWLLNEGLELAVYLQLVAWKEDGTLGDLINEILFTSKLDKVTFEEFKLEYNDFVDTTNGNINDLLEDMNDFKTETEGDLAHLKEYVDDEIEEVSTKVDENSVIFQNKINDVLVSVKEYGAKGDGETDDTIAIQNCFNENKNVFIPEGIYLVGELIISNDSFMLNGSGMHNTILKPIDEVDFIIKIMKDVHSTSIKNIKIDGDEKSNMCVYGETYTPYLYFERVFMQKAKEVCLNVATYASQFNNCFTQFSKVGFKIRGDVGNITTSITMNSCYANVMENIGFDLGSPGTIVYSTLNSCAVDNSKIAYKIISNGMVLNSCGSEKTEQYLIGQPRSLTINSAYTMYMGTINKEPLISVDNPIGLIINNFITHNTNENNKFLKINNVDFGTEYVEINDPNITRDKVEAPSTSWRFFDEYIKMTTDMIRNTKTPTELNQNNFKTTIDLIKNKTSNKPYLFKLTENIEINGDFYFPYFKGDYIIDLNGKTLKGNMFVISCDNLTLKNGVLKHNTTGPSLYIDNAYNILLKDIVFDNGSFVTTGNQVTYTKNVTGTTIPSKVIQL